MTARKKRPNGATKSGTAKVHNSTYQLSDDDQATISAAQKQVQDLKVMHFDMVNRHEKEVAAVKTAVAKAHENHVATVRSIGLKHGANLDTGQWKYNPESGTLLKQTSS